jgi:ABC-type multidrug transport system fused ATPase/permease subunit
MEPDKKIAPKTAREYLKQLAEAVQQVTWVFSEFFTPKLRRLSALVLVTTFITMGLGFVVPLFSGRMVDGVLKHNLNLVWWSLGLSLALIIVGFVVEVVNDLLQLRLDATQNVAVQEKISRRFFEKSLGQHLREGTELSVGNVQKGYSAVDDIINLVLFQMTSTLAQTLAAFVLMWWLSPSLALVLVVTGVLYAVASLVLNRLSLVANETIDEKRRFVDRYRNDRWNAVERCQNNGRGEDEVRAIAAASLDFNNAYLRLWQRLDPLFSLRGLGLDFIALAIMGWGLWLVWQGHLTVGAMLPIISWSRSYATGLRQFGWMERNLHRSLPAIQSLRKAVFIPTDIMDKPDAILVSDAGLPRVEFRDVGLTYAAGSDESDKPKSPVLRHVSFVIEPGEKLAIVGPSGAGKTTISRLLLRYQDPSSGSILIDGRDLRDYRHDSWIATVGHIAQQPQVFDGTIRDNLLYGLTPVERAKVSDPELWDVMRRLKIDFGQRLTDGLDTKVGRSGLKLSGGEAQRLLIGAAVIRHPRLMIIDEATSSLDSTTEREVQSGLEEVLKGGMSALVIAHRLSTVQRLCTKFVVLRPVDGLAEGEPQIEAIAGSFEELYQISPTFRHLADDQGLSLCLLPGVK